MVWMKGISMLPETYQENFEALMKKAGNPYPDSGAIFYASTEDRYAPFKILNPETKPISLRPIRTTGRFRKDILTFFIEPNSEATVYMPLGNYKIKYAVGSGPWYGEKMLFGPETQTYAITDFFPFTSDSGYYYGHSLTMQVEGSGNLVTDFLPLKDF